MSYNIGPKIGIEGETEFRNSLRKINDTYKALQAETKAVSAAFSAQGDEQGRLKAVAAQLGKQIEEQKKKQQLLEDAVQKASAKYGESSIEATRLRGALFDTQATISNLEQELRDTEQQLNGTSDSMEELADDTETASDAGLSFKDVFSANLIADVVMDGIRNLASELKDFAVGSVEAAADVQASASQFEQTFGSMQEAASESLERISEDTNVATTRMQDSFTSVYAFAKTAGADSTEALTLATRALSAATDSAAYYDKTIEEATETLQSFLKGNYANDAALGISATETTRNTAANKLYAKSFNELSESQKVDVLLSMVEAGNEASGAIGQAARESDSWSNVTGELSEMMRQLQANAGKSALKSLTPVIKKITKAGYELIEDIDWDAFGDTVTGIIEGVIDYGPGVVKAVAAVTAGIVAMKAVKRAEELTKVAKSFFSIGDGAKAAGDAAKSAGNIKNFNGWSIAAGVIGTAVSAVTAYVFAAEDAKSELAEAMEGFVEDMRDAQEAYETTISETEGVAYAAEHYIEKLFELEDAGLSTAAAQREYATIVEQLNELIPELNLQIDEQTGLVNKSKEEISACVDEWKAYYTQQALRTRYTEELKAYGEAEAEIIDTEIKLKNVSEKLQNAEAKREDLREKLLDIDSALVEVNDELNESLAHCSDNSGDLIAKQEDLQEQYDALYEEFLQYDAAVVNARNKQEQYEKEIGESNKLLKIYSTRLDEAENAEKQYAEMREAEDKLTEEQRKIQEVTAAMEELEASYSTACQEAEKSLSTQIGLFDELADSSDWTAQKIIDNWKDQQEAFSNYEENLQKAVDLGLDEALVSQLSDGSEESMQILNALVNDTSISVDEINEAFSNVSASRTSLSKTMGGIQTDYDTKMNALVQKANSTGAGIGTGLTVNLDAKRTQFANSLKAMRDNAQNTLGSMGSIGSSGGSSLGSGLTSSLNAKQPQFSIAANSMRTTAQTALNGMNQMGFNSGSSLGAGLISGMNYQRTSIWNAAYNLGTTILTAFNSRMKINSPSKVMEYSAENVVDGGVVGLQENTKKFESAMEQLATNGLAAFNVPKLEVISSLPDYVMAPAQRSSVTHSYGGVTIQIQQRDGESADDLARRVADVLMHEIEVKEAGF